MRTISIVIAALTLALPSVLFAQTPQAQPGDTIIAQSSIAPVTPIPVSNSLRGSTLLSGTGSFSYNRQKLADWGWEGSATETTIMYGFDVRFDRVLLEHLAFGCALSFIEISYRISGSRYDDGHTSAGLMGIGPRLGYYWGDRNSSILPYLAGEFDLTAISMGSAGSGTSAIKAGGGVIYQIRPRIGLSFELNYVNYGTQRDVINIIGQAGLVALLY